MAKFPPRGHEKLYQDEIYHDKVLSPLAIAVIDTAEFQRLEGMKQLAFSYLAFRGASHTRFSHSVGVYFATRTLMRRIVQNHERVFRESNNSGMIAHPGWYLSEKFVLIPEGSGVNEKDYTGYQGRWRGMTEIVSIAALLHDIGHVPFGHTLEDEFSGFFERHDSLVSHRVYKMLFDPSSELSKVFSTDRGRWILHFSNEELRQLIFLILSFKEKITEDGYTSFSKFLDSEIRRAETRARDEEEQSGEKLDKRKKQDGTARTGQALLLERLKELQQLYVTFSGVEQTYSKQIFHPFMSDAIANTICADLLDYLVRDQRNLGLESHSHHRILRYFLIRPGNLDGENGALRLSVLVCRPDKGGQRRDVATSILDIMRDRYHMVERALYHHKKCAASAMLAKLFEICRDKPKDDENVYPAPWTHSRRPDHVVHFSDYELIECLGNHEIADEFSELRKKLHLGLRYRKLYRTLLVVDVDLAKQCRSGKDFFPNRFRGMSDDLASAQEARKFRSDFERDLALVAYPGRSDKYGSVLIYCPSNKMQAKEIDVRTELEPGIVRPLRTEEDQFALNQDIQVLKKYYSDLWRMYLFVEPEIYADSQSCLNIIEAFAKKCEIPDVRLVLKKARKPELMKLYETRAAPTALPVQTDIAFEETRATRELAAKGSSTTALPAVQDQALMSNGEVPLEDLTDDECFRALVPALANSPPKREHLAVLLEFLKENSLGPLRGHIRFLRFVERTLEHFRYDAKALWTKEMLLRWFREGHGDQFGSKP